MVASRNLNTKTLWDFDICTDCDISVHDLDIVIVNNNTYTHSAINAAVPADIENIQSIIGFIKGFMQFRI